VLFLLLTVPLLLTQQVLGGCESAVLLALA
jgi:hypothetical protein